MGFGLGWSWGRRGRAWVERFALHCTHSSGNGMGWDGMGCVWKQYAGSHFGASEHVAIGH